MIDWPSGAHAGAPCRSSESATTRAFVPSACITYKSVCPCCRTENAMFRPSGAIAGPPKTSCLPDHSTTPWPFRWRASRYSRRAGRRNIQKVIWTQSWGEPRAGGQRDLSRGRYSPWGESSSRMRQSVLRRSGESGNQPATVRAGRQRRVPVKAGGQPVGNAALDVHAIKPRPEPSGSLARYISVRRSNRTG